MEQIIRIFFFSKFTTRDFQVLYENGQKDIIKNTVSICVLNIVW